jgi:ubiquinone/menaquinone biosynthesis C-methylase UbiE
MKDSQSREEASYQILQSCKENFSHLERWPTYFDRRYLEFLSYSELFPVSNLGNVLELGCGIGFQSALLSTMSESVVATDLPDENMSTHTPGKIRLQSLLTGLGIENVSHQFCSAESLPFEDNSFDMVFSSHVLEHIPDFGKAMKEIYRVLKPNGFLFCVIPSSFDKPYAFLNHYLNLISLIPKYILNKLISIKQDHSSSTNLNDNVTKNVQDRSIYNYLIPTPHGEASSFFSEFKLWSPSNWKSRITNEINVSLVSQSTTQYFPFLPLLGFLNPRIGVKLHSSSRKFERKTGKLKIFQLLGINSVLIYKK